MFRTRKVINIITKESYNKTIEFNITCLEKCDRLDSNYVEMKAYQITNATEAKIETINSKLDIKLKQ